MCTTRTAAVRVHICIFYCNNATIATNDSTYLHLIGTTTVDLVQALHWYQQAAAQEHPPAQFSVGYFCERGRGGIPIDLVQALHWYQQAAAQEDPDAQFAVGHFSIRTHSNDGVVGDVFVSPDDVFVSPAIEDIMNLRVALLLIE